MTNLKKLLAEIAKTTSQFLEQQSTEDEKPDACDVAPNEFAIIIKVDADSGDAQFGVAWPTEIPPAQRIDLMSKMLLAANSGMWKGAMAQAVKHFGNDSGQSDIAQAIIEHWSNLLGNEQGDKLCVEPTEVFQRRGEQ